MKRGRSEIDPFCQDFGEGGVMHDWIPVSERLPYKGKQVLCCNKNGSVFTSAITYINSNGMVAFGQHLEVIAWMPLPKPWRGEQG